MVHGRIPLAQRETRAVALRQVWAELRLHYGRCTLHCITPTARVVQAWVVDACVDAGLAAASLRTGIDVDSAFGHDLKVICVLMQP